MIVNENTMNREICATFNVGAMQHSQRLYGVEIELEGMRGDVSPPPRWFGTGDGSLRNGGIEYVSQGAQPIASLATGIARIYDNIERYGLVRTIRTSIHVHANVSNLTMRQLQGILTLYCLMEPTLMRLCGPFREENIFCVPWYRSDSEVRVWSRVVAQTPVRARMEASGFCKYSALNLLPLTRFGTIEFRMAPVWNTVTEALRWLGMIDAMMEYGIATPAHHILERYSEEGRQGLMIDVFDGDSPYYCQGREERVVQEIAEVLAERVACLSPDMDDSPWPEPSAADDLRVLLSPTNVADLHPYLDMTNILYVQDSDDEDVDDDGFPRAEEYDSDLEPMFDDDDADDNE